MRKEAGLFMTATRLLLAAAAVLAPGPLLGAPTVRLYVAAGAGDDRGPGTRAAPLRTIEEAQRRVRRALSHGAPDEISVDLRGTFAITRPLRFDERDSGRAGHSVTWRGWPGKRACLTGGRRITRWEPVGHGVYRARLGEGPYPHALFEDGEWAVPARFPNAGYLRTETGVTDQGKPVVTCKLGDLPEGDLAGASVAIWAGTHFGGWTYDWYQSLVPIEVISRPLRTLRLSDPTWWAVGAGNRYFLFGARALLDAPGEYYVDRAERALYYRPRRLPIESRHIVAPMVERLIDIQGSSMTHPVEWVTFRDLDLEVTDSLDRHVPGVGWSEGLAFLCNARSVSFEGCRIRCAGVNAISAYGMNEGHTIRDCAIEQAGFCGAMLTGYAFGAGPFGDPREAYVSRGFRITNNVIRDCGRRIGHGSGIWVSQSGGHEISHNLIQRVPRYGVNLVGQTYNQMILPAAQGGQGGSIYGHRVTWSNHRDFVYTRDERVIDNVIADTMLDSSDGGAIYAWGAGPGITIAGNVIRSMSTSEPHRILAGIYLDDGSTGCAVRDNLVTGVRGTDMTVGMIVKGRGNMISGNVLVNNLARAAFFVIEAGAAGRPDSPPGAEDEQIRDLRFTGNIVCRNGAPSVYMFYPWRDTLIDKADRNVLYHPEGRHEVTVDWQARPWSDWRSRLAGKYDAHSVLVEPRFTAPTRMDYRVTAPRGAWPAGVSGHDFSRAGPTGGSAARQLRARQEGR